MRISAPIREFWRRYKKSKGGVIGGIVIAVFVFLAIFAPILSPYPPLRPLTGASFEPPSSAHPFGTDDLGRDIFSGVLNGARVSLLVGLVSAGIGTIVGILTGAIAGFYGGLIDELLMRITDIFLIIPMFALGIVIVALFGASFTNIILTVGMLSWPSTSRLVRSQYLSIKETQFVEAARSVGASEVRINFSEILPHAISPVVVNASYLVANAIMMEAGLSFLGLGDPNIASWGYMSSTAQQFIRRDFWMTLFPGMALFAVSLALNLVGDALNDVLNPKLKEG